MSEQTGGEGALERERDLEEEERKIAENAPEERDATGDTSEQGLDPGPDPDTPGAPPPNLQPRG